MNELIEKLKDNERIFGRLDNESQKVFVNVGKINCIYYTGTEWIQTDNNGAFTASSLYRIKRDYQPEAESRYVSYDVSVTSFKKYFVEELDEYLIDAIGMVGFVGVEYEDEQIRSWFPANKIHVCKENIEKLDIEYIKPVKVWFLK